MLGSAYNVNLYVWSYVFPMVLKTGLVTVVIFTELYPVSPMFQYVALCALY